MHLSSTVLHGCKNWKDLRPYETHYASPAVCTEQRSSLWSYSSDELTSSARSVTSTLVKRHRGKAQGRQVINTRKDAPSFKPYIDAKIRDEGTKKGTTKAQMTTVISTFFAITLIRSVGNSVHTSCVLNSGGRTNLWRYPGIAKIMSMKEMQHNKRCSRWTVLSRSLKFRGFVIVPNQRCSVYL